MASEVTPATILSLVTVSFRYKGQYSSHRAEFLCFLDIGMHLLSQSSTTLLSIPRAPLLSLASSQTPHPISFGKHYADQSLLGIGEFSFTQNPN